MTYLAFSACPGPLIGWPDAGKIAKGRVPCYSSLLEASERTTPLEAFEAPPVRLVTDHGRRVLAAPVPAAVDWPPVGPVIDMFEELKRRLPKPPADDLELSTTAALMVGGSASQATGWVPPEMMHWAGPWEGYRSRSDLVFRCVNDLVRWGCDETLAVALLTDRELGFSDHVFAQKRPEQYARRQYQRALERVERDFTRDPKTGSICHTEHNILIALAKLGVELSHDAFARKDLISGGDWEPNTWFDDVAAAKLWLMMERRFGFRPRREYFETVINVALHENSFHPVRDYLGGLQWDGVERIDRWLVDYAGAEDTPYVRAVGRLWLVAAVRRVRQPGVKFDEMLVLEGPQGDGKSSLLRTIAVRDEWFGDDLPLGAGSREVVEQLDGKWIVEAAELNGLKKAGVAHLKALLSRQFDRARLAYARRTVEAGRQCVFSGTVNQDEYLEDRTGNRRWWPMKCGVLDIEGLRGVLDQIWAEAAAAEAAGESIRLDKSLWAVAAEVQNKRLVKDPFEDTLRAVLGDLTGKLKSTDAWDLIGVQSGQQTA